MTKLQPFLSVAHYKALQNLWQDAQAFRRYHPERLYSDDGDPGIILDKSLKSAGIALDALRQALSEEWQQQNTSHVR